MRPAIPNWRLNPELLNNLVFRKAVRTGVTQYFLENEGTASSIAVEWDAFKVVVRGLCITNVVGVWKTLLQDIDTAGQRLREQERTRPGQPQRHRELLEAREAVAVAVERLHCFDYKKYVACAHIERDKSGTLLAWLANPERRGSTILELYSPSGELCRTHQGINEQFLAYYTELYQSKIAMNEDVLGEFLGAADLPEIDNLVAEQLGQDITLGEVRGAIKHMACKKTPGAD